MTAPSIGFAVTISNMRTQKKAGNAHFKKAPLVQLSREV